jgi:hypothetical protein
VRHAVHDALKEQPDLMDADISIDQAQKLFANTIRAALKSTPTLPVAITIDALDETDFKRLADTVEIFARVITDLPRNAKVFISSRSEDVTRYVCLHLSSALVRHLSAKDSIEEVTKFLRRKIEAIMKKHHISLS